MKEPVAALLDCLGRHAPGRPVGVAVSGGGDSMALLVLAAEAGLAGGAATVDHGLRPEAPGEAAAVGALCARLSVPHAVLPWRHAGAGNLQAAARAGRRDLLACWARARGLRAVLLGHTLDDQAETVLMRLARGSGVDGLSGMEESFALGDVLFLRPFLSVPRAALREVLKARGIGWCEDGSNADARFQRVRARQALTALGPLGITAQGLAATAARLRDARAALEAQVDAVLSRHAREAAGMVVLSRAVLDLPAEVRDRVFLRVLQGLCGPGYPPRRAALTRWIAQAQARIEAGRGGALRGCVLQAGPDGLLLHREPAAVQGQAVPAGQVWDRRWQAVAPPSDREGPSGASGLELRALGAAGLLALSRGAKAGCHAHWRALGLPRAALAAQPGLWRGDRLVAAPGAGWPAGWRLRVTSALGGRAVLLPPGEDGLRGDDGLIHPAR